MADEAPGGSPDQPAPPTSAAPSTWPDQSQAAPFATAGPSSAVPVGPGPLEAAPPPPADVVPPPPGFTAPPVPRGRRTGWRRWLPLAGVIGLIAGCSVAMLFILGRNLGPVGVAVGLTAAILPVPVLVSAFLWLDRYEPEPNKYLAFCFGWGASVATLAAIAVNSGMASLFEKAGLPEALVAVLVAPFIEESMKALGPILLLWRRRREWSGITDGIVYCGLSAIGFAMVENVLYLGGHGYAAGADEYGTATGLQNVFAIFIVRILFTGFAHPLFTSMSGVGLGIAARSGDRRVKWLAPLAGLLLAMILHGTFNLLPTLTAATGETLIMLYGYLGFMVPFFFTVVGLAIALRGWEGRLSERILPSYVRAGWFSPPEVAALGSLGRRHSARRWAMRVAGEPGLKAMKGFQFAATRLALLRDGMQRGLDRKPEEYGESAAEEQQLLEAIAGYRAVFVGRDPLMPAAFWDGTNYQISFPDGSTRAVPPPASPVVPLPIQMPALPPAPALVGYGPPGYGAAPITSGYGNQSYGAGPATSGWGAQGSGDPGYGGQSSYGSQPGYGGQSSYGSQPGYGAQSPYSSQPGYGAQSPYGAQPGYGGQSPYGAQPTYGSQPFYGHDPGQGRQPVFPQPGTQPHPTAGAQPGSSWPQQPFYGDPQSFGATPTPPGVNPAPSEWARPAVEERGDSSYPEGSDRERPG